MRAGEHIGARVALERRLRGLTQRQLADRAHVSVSLLRKVEQGSRPASPALVSALAAALRLEQARLTGQPYFSGDRRLDSVHDLVPDLRRELTLYGLPPTEDFSPIPPAVLGVRVAECSALVHSVKYSTVGSLLPGLLADLRAASHATNGYDRAQVMLMAAETYDNAKRFAYDLGYADLGTLAVSLKERAAVESEDPLAIAVAHAVRAWTLTGTGAFSSAHGLLSRSLDDLEGDLHQATPQTWSVWGFLNLQAALASARIGDAANTWSHYAAAEDAARQHGRDRDDYRLTFGPTNTAIWGVGLAVELMDGPGAVVRARSVTIPSDLPRARVGHHYLDLARAHLYAGDNGSALDALQAARKTAPQQVRHLPMARETVYALARAERVRSESLRGLAAWMGLHD